MITAELSNYHMSFLQVKSINCIYVFNLNFYCMSIIWTSQIILRKYQEVHFNEDEKTHNPTTQKKTVILIVYILLELVAH